MNIIRLQETESTNDYAINLFNDSMCAEPTLVIADFQTKGKGFHTNMWESEREKNLTFSLILKPTIDVDQQFFMNKAISLGIYDFLRNELSNCNIAIKWPNDIYVDDKKICGILIQNFLHGNSFKYVVVGIGLNVNQEIFVSNAPNPTSMKLANSKDYNREIVLENLLKHLMKRYEQLQANEHDIIELDYLSAMYRINQPHTFIMDKQVFTATIKGTTQYGQLILEKEDGNMLQCDFKGIEFII